MQIKINNDLKDKFFKSAKEHNDNFEPILRGCRNETCFCTGKCREIIGYREKTLLEKTKNPFTRKINQNELH